MFEHTPEFDILPTKSTINPYNRYPFADYSDAVNNLLAKSLQPGEIAVAYYWDKSQILGINAIFAIGNLKKAGNIIFKNAQDIDFVYRDAMNKIMQLNIAINECVMAVNAANKKYGLIHQEVKDVLDYARSLEERIKTIEWIDLDSYTDDL